MEKEQEIEMTTPPVTTPVKPNKQGELILNEERANDDGEIRVSPNVIAKIARRTTLAVDGVDRFCPKGFSDLKNIFSTRSYDSSMDISFEDGLVNITLSILCYFGAKIRDVCKEIQTRVREQVEQQSGAKVGIITVQVKDLLDPEEEVPEDDELEEDAEDKEVDA